MYLLFISTCSTRTVLWGCHRKLYKSIALNTSCPYRVPRGDLLWQEEGLSCARTVKQRVTMFGKGIARPNFLG